MEVVEKNIVNNNYVGYRIPFKEIPNIGIPIGHALMLQIDIHRDLEAYRVDFFRKATNTQDSSIWIRDKRTGKRLEVQLEPMRVKYPKMYLP